MSRKKSITITRKPVATTAPIVSGEIQTSSALETTSSVLPEVEAADTYGLLGKALYWPVYCVTYGVVFGAMAIGTLLPGKTIIGRAMVDATVSAKRPFGGSPQRQKKYQHDSRKDRTSAHTTAESAQPAGLVA